LKIRYKANTSDYLVIYDNYNPVNFGGIIFLFYKKIL